VSVPIDVCASCGEPIFPPRALCPVCGACDWHNVEMESGRVEAVTGRDDVSIAAVRVDGGPIIVARCAEGVTVGAHVSLGLDASAPTAQVRSAAATREPRVAVPDGPCKGGVSKPPSWQSE
jgi:uncharacterized OB-fold protein